MMPPLPPPPSLLTPERLAAFERCPRRAWLQVHRRDLVRPDESAVSRFAPGHIPEEILDRLHPEALRIPAQASRADALRETAQVIAADPPGPILGATFEHEGLCVRVDMLVRGGAKGWEVVQVQGAMGVKAHHTADLATQVWVLGGAGLAVSRASIRHVDRDFVLAQDGDYAALFLDADLTEVVRAQVRERAQVAAQAREIVSGDEPRCAMGPQCARPTACEFAAHCRVSLPPSPEWPVTILPNGAWKKWARLGYDDLLALDEAQMVKPREVRIVAATRSGEPFHDAPGARKAMAAWSYPRAWLDFETVAPVLPLWRGTRPYQTIPFQFSLHLEHEDGTITHHEYLCCDGSDPREGCAAALVDAIPAQATIIAYNAGFERAVLRALAAQVPAHGEALEIRAANTVDLLPVARNHWYHREQRGSWSIKAVLPTMAPELDYAGLEVKDGGMAQDSFLEAINPATPTARRYALAEALKAYCARDTWAMVVLARRLVAGSDGESSRESDSGIAK